MKKKKRKKENEKEKEEKNAGKFWPIITLVPSSKLVCVFKCWDSSSNIIQLPNISLCHEGNKENEEKISQQVEGNYVFGKMIMSTNHKGEKIQQILSMKMRSFLKWKFRVMNSIELFLTPEVINL